MDHSCLSCGQDQAIGTGAICAKCLADKREFAETVSAARQANRDRGSSDPIMVFAWLIPIV
jgi:hypothetical protein